MQQKYCDHGRSSELFDDDAADVAGAQLLRLGRETEKRVDLAFGEQVHRPDGLTRDPTDILIGDEPDVGEPAAHEHVRAGA
jgi:hypothetical protein